MNAITQAKQLLDEMRVEQHRRVKEAVTRQDKVAEEEARRQIARIGSATDELEILARPPGRSPKPVVVDRDVADAAKFAEPVRERTKRIDRLMQHFRFAEAAWFIANEGKKGLPTPMGLLWLLVQDAVHTSQNLPDRERQALSRVGSVMPEMRAASHDLASVHELNRRDYEAQVARLQAGMRQQEHIKVRETPSGEAVDRMTDVLDLFRFVVAGRKGKDASRLKAVVRARAAGLSLEQCGRIWDAQRKDFDRKAMSDTKQRVLGQILSGIEREFGLIRTSRSFRRLTVREIEARAKARKRLEAETDAE